MTKLVNNSFLFFDINISSIRPTMYVDVSELLFIYYLLKHIY